MDENVLQVMEKIIRNQQLIQEVYADENEIYFKYWGVCFSVVKHTGIEQPWGEYSFFVYPNYSSSLQDLADRFQQSPVEVKYVAYHLSDIPDERVAVAMKKLYRTVRERAFGVDTLFQSIIHSPDVATV